MVRAAQKATNLMYFVTFIYMCSYEIKQLAFVGQLVFFLHIRLVF